MSSARYVLFACCLVCIAGCTDEATPADSAVLDQVATEASVDVGQAPDSLKQDGEAKDTGQAPDLAPPDLASPDAGKPDSAKKADSAGTQPKIKGRIRLLEMHDARINTVLKPQVQVAFADTCFFETTFVPKTIFGECAVGTMMPPPPCITNYVDGGPVTITGGDVGLSYKYKPKGPYSGNLPSTAYSVFSNGQTLSIKGGGSARVPAKFSATLAAPADLAVSVPAMKGATTAVSTKADWTIKWTKSSAHKVNARLRCVGGSTSLPVAVECSSKDDGAIVVKAAALAAMAAGCKGKVDIDVERVNEVAIPNPKAQISARVVTSHTGGVILK